MAKVMENLIQQNFELIFFLQFSTGFAMIAENCAFRGLIYGQGA
jgi:hypothetical protein